MNQMLDQEATPTPARFTDKQGQYLAFIWAYTQINAYSRPSWARIPREGGHDFQAMVGMDSTGRWAPFLMG
jgi:hypothetical protein